MEMRKLRDFITQVVKPIQTRIMMAIARAVVESVDDSMGIQIVKINVLKGEAKEGVERLQNFGFTGNPPDGSEAACVFVSGNRDHGLVVGVDHRASRKKDLAKGESAQYSVDGTFIHIKLGGEIEIKGSTKLTVDMPDTVFKGNVQIDEDLVVKKNATIECNLFVTKNAAITLIISASGFSGLSGAPVSATVDIATTGNVIGGGTNMASIKSTFNSHTHNETGTVTGAPNSPL